MDPLVNELAESLRDLLKGRLDTYLSSRKDQKDFLEDRTKRLAWLTVELARTVGDTDKQAEIKKQMTVVSDTIVNELHAAAIDISTEFREAVNSVIGTVLDYAIKVIPKLIPALAAI